jgi:Asp-tRNA(Asn)/Glu-tRNA(Gln) amidotransferase A subunit family amidase
MGMDKDQFENMKSGIIKDISDEIEKQKEFIKKSQSEIAKLEKLLNTAREIKQVKQPT